MAGKRPQGGGKKAGTKASASERSKAVADKAPKKRGGPAAAKQASVPAARAAAAPKQQAGKKRSADDCLAEKPKRRKQNCAADVPKEGPARKRLHDEVQQGAAAGQALPLAAAPTAERVVRRRLNGKQKPMPPFAQGPTHARTTSPEHVAAPSTSNFSQAPPQQPGADSGLGLRFVGKYEVKSLIGEGTFSKVFSCTSRGRSFALKVQRIDQPEDRAAIDFEAELHAALSKVKPSRSLFKLVGSLAPKGRWNGIALLRDHFHVEELNSYAMVQDLAGPSLCWIVQEHKRQKATMHTDLIRRIASHALLALEHLHVRCEVVHCDIKPENIVVAAPTADLQSLGKSNFLLIDLGTTFPIGTDLGGKPSLPFRSPEVLLKKGCVGTPADLWALGITLAEVLIGQPLLSLETALHPLGLSPDERDALWEGQALEEMTKIFGRMPGRWRAKLQAPKAPLGLSTALAQKRPDVPEGAAGFLEGMLQLDLEKRVSAAAALEHPWLQCEQRGKRKPAADAAERAPKRARAGA